MMQNNERGGGWNVPVSKVPLWLATLAAAGVATTLGLACAVPLAAFATLAALTLDRCTALFTITLVVAANQALGFTVLHYPHDPATMAWGGAFLLAGLAATLVAAWIKRCLADYDPALGAGAAFMAAFATYESIFLSVTLLSGGALYAYAAPVMLRIFAVNVVTFAGLLLVARLVFAHRGLKAAVPAQ